MTDNTYSLIDIINKYWIQIIFVVGALVAIGEARYRVNDHSRRIKNLEDDLKDIRKEISDKLEKIYTILIERK